MTLSKYGMNEYFGDVIKSRPEEVIVEIRTELTSLITDLLSEKPCSLIFVGNKSLTLYNAFLDDIVRHGFEPGYLGIFHESSIGIGELENGFILITDSINSGSEVIDILKGIDTNLIRIYCYFATLKSIELVTQTFNFPSNIIKCVHQVSSVEEYREKSLRTKIFSYSNMVPGPFDIRSFSREYVTSEEEDSFLKSIHNAVTNVLGCQEIAIEKDPIFNLMIPKIFAYYVFECCKLPGNCKTLFNITDENNDNSSNDFIPICLQFLFKIEKTEVGYTLKSLIEPIYDEMEITKEKIQKCRIKKLDVGCVMEKIIDGSTDAAPLLPLINCRSCIQRAIINPLNEKILESPSTLI